MPVSITLDKTRELKFDIRACRELESHLGKPLGAIIGDISNFGVNAIVTSLYFGLKHGDKALNIALVEKMFSAYVAARRPMSAITRKLNDALDETGLFQREETVEDDEGNVPAAS